MKVIRIFIAFIAVTSMLYANGKESAKDLGLNPSSKAIKQWQRVFKKERKMKKLGIDKLSAADKKALEQYLENHAADSDHPEAAGI